MSHLFGFELMEPQLAGEAGASGMFFLPTLRSLQNGLAHYFFYESNHFLSNNFGPSTVLGVHMHYVSSSQSPARNIQGNQGSEMQRDLL